MAKPQKNNIEELTIDQQKAECASLLKKLIDHYWKPDPKDDIEVYVAESAYVNRFRMYTKEFPYNGIDFTKQLPGIYLGFVRNNNRILHLLSTLFTGIGLNEIKNPNSKCIGHTFCAYQVTTSKGLHKLLLSLNRLPELKIILDEEKAIEEARLAEIRKRAEADHNVKLSATATLCISSYLEVENLLQAAARNDDEINEEQEELDEDDDVTTA